MEWTIQNKKWKVAELKLAYKTKVKADLRPKVTSSKDSFAIFKENWDMTKIELVEQFKVLFTNRANKCLGIVDISSGGITGTVADPKIILAAALKCGACGFVLCHNHPSGNLTASQSDIDLTRKLKEGGKLLEIQYLDHIIITATTYLSFADEGLI